MSEKEILQFSEEDIKLRYITPAILKKGWSVEDITMETKVKITDGKINLKGNLVARAKPKYADYMLYYNRATPIAQNMRASTTCRRRTSGRAPALRPIRSPRKKRPRRASPKRPS